MSLICVHHISTGLSSYKHGFLSHAGSFIIVKYVPLRTFGGFPGGSDGKASAYIVGDLGSIPGLGRSSGEGNGYPLRYSGLENSTDSIVHGVAKSQTRLSDFHSQGVHLVHF